MVAAEAWYAAKSLGLAFCVLCGLAAGVAARHLHVSEPAALLSAFGVIIFLASISLFIWRRFDGKTAAAKARRGPILFPVAALCIMAWYVAAVVHFTRWSVIDFTTLVSVGYLAITIVPMLSLLRELRRGVALR
jgi:hypothetical protein